METRANYALIGAFTLAGIVGAFVFLLWLAKLDVDRQLAYYDVLFENVSGLSTAGVVRYNGLPVGQVVDLKLDPDDPSRVRVRIEVDAKTPIRTDTIAQLNAQGVTGVSFVALTGGSADADPLPKGAMIMSQASPLQTLFESAPELLEKAILLLEDVREVVSDDNRQAVSDTLNNLSSASGRLDSALADFENLSGDLGEAAQAIAGFTERLETLSETAEVTLEEATTTLQTVRAAVDTAGSAFGTADGLMQGELKEFIERGADAAQSIDAVVTTLEPSALSAFQAAQALIEERIPALVTQLEDTARVLEEQVASVGGDASDLMARYDEVGASLKARVDQTSSAIAAFETATIEATSMMESFRETSETAGDLIQEDLKPLAKDATATMASARALAEDQLPGLIEQTQSTLATVETEAAALSADGREMLDQATARLIQSQSTLEALESSLSQADQMMASLTETSDSIGDVVRGDGAALVAEARVAAQEARAAVETINRSVQEDLPGLLEDMKGAARTANRVIDTVGAEVVEAGGHLDALSVDAVQALEAATEAFTNANTTLESITSAMDAAVGTMDSAETTFDSINTVIDEDLDMIVADIRRAVDAFTTTVTDVSVDVGQVSDEILAASQSASNLVGTVDAIVQNNSRQVSDFMRVGLPHFTRFIEESRLLVSNLDRLVDRVQRDPARFLLGTQNSEFRR